MRRAPLAALVLALAGGASAGDGSPADERPLLLRDVGLAAVIQVVLFFQMGELWRARQKELPPPVPVAQALPSAPPEPRLQIAPSLDLKALRATEDAQLHGYGWVDRKAGVVHIPIERAMDLVAQEAVR